MPDLGVPELLIIAFVVVLLFGSKKLPDAARSIGRSLRIFKAETKGLREDDKADEPKQIDNTAAPVLPSAPVTPSPTPVVTHTAPAKHVDAERR